MPRSANAGTRTDLRRILALSGFTLKGECVRAERITLTVHLHFREANHQTRTSSHAAGALDFGHVAMQCCTGGHDREAIHDNRLTQTRGHWRFDLRRFRRERRDERQ
jgi:hypothetical protein